jgi:GNAT superfamily N-acetyltransferase
MKQHSQESGEKVSPEAAPLRWELKVATAADVDPTLEQLTDHMNDQQRVAFRKKLERYVRKPDRDLILAVKGSQVLGLVCVIDRIKPPSNFHSHKAHHLQNFAFGTQLLVHPSVRRHGIGSNLQLRAEQWARERGRTGHYLITHRMADWYQRNFGHEEIGRINDKGIEKIVMSKQFV